MAPLPSQICRHAIELRAMIAEGRDVEANRLVIAQLSGGAASSAFQKEVAKMLAPAPQKKPGRPPKAVYRWFEIGTAYYELLSDGVQKTKAKEAVAERFGREDITRAISYYDNALEADREDGQ